MHLKTHRSLVATVGLCAIFRQQGRKFLQRIQIGVISWSPLHAIKIGR